MPGTKRLGALLALVAAVVAVSGCGSDEISGEIPTENATRLNAALAGVRTAVDSGPTGCQQAADQTDLFVYEVNRLPADPSAELKAELQAAGDHLRALVDNECALTEPPTTTSITTSTTSTSTPSTTETSTTDTSTTDTTTTSTDQTQPPGNGNGNGPPGGVPPGQDGGTGGTGSGSGDETDE
ncbi:MAG: hypothetical protein AABM66_03670 [Actinomycetota bacterium]